MKLIEHLMSASHHLKIVLLLTLTTLSLTLCSPSWAEVSKPTCHQGMCKKQHIPVNRQNILRQSRLKTLEKDKRLKSPSTSTRDVPKFERPPQIREAPQRQETSSAQRSQLNLKELGVSYKACKDFTESCRTRVDSLEQYRKTAKEVIKKQEGEITSLKEKKKEFPWTHVAISVLLGVVTGGLLL